MPGNLIFKKWCFFSQIITNSLDLRYYYKCLNKKYSGWYRCQTTWTVTNTVQKWRHVAGANSLVWSQVTHRKLCSIWQLKVLCVPLNLLQGYVKINPIISEKIFVQSNVWSTYFVVCKNNYYKYNHCIRENIFSKKYLLCTLCNAWSRRRTRFLVQDGLYNHLFVSACESVCSPFSE